MSAGNTLAAVPSSSGLKRRHNSSSEDLDSCPPKRWYYVLASESDLESDGTESIYSLQEKSTDLAKDTSDTCTKSSWSSDDEGRMIEFEVVSFTEEEQYHPPQSKDSSSSPEDLLSSIPLTEKQGSQNTTMSADNSNLESDGEILNINFHKGGLYKFCFRCKQTNETPFFRYCIRCYKLRKNFLPPRPKGGRKKRLPNANVDSKNSIDSGIGLSSSQSIEKDIVEEFIANKSNNDINHSSSDLCNICMIRTKDGGYSHGHIVHNYSCYKCSVKIYNQSGRCPVCNTKVKQICKIIR
ncbi:E3 ubiquitin-protein ligase Mdm2-like isoform X2 [Rhodnius prolixus]|uniref:RING-type domain-containing protein n=1 Tax=Rhodnius prolixus TaxID=13249 RepID=T1ICP4_RHOPR